ncbi:class II peroxidase, partial [Lepidopterella palustris CBS 459.81]
MATAARCFTRSALRSSPATFKTTTTRNARFIIPRQAFRQQSRRGYADSGAPKSGSSGLLWGGVGLAALGGGYWYYTQNPGAFSKADEKAKGPFVPTFEDYQKVYNAVAKALEEHDNYDDGSYGPVLVRLAWHCSGTYDKETGTGGSNGATMRFSPESDHGANAGLKAARDFLEPIK